VHSGRRSAWRNRKQRSGLAPVAAQLAAPVVLGLLVGGVLAYQAGSSNNLVHPVPLGAVATPTPSFGKPSASTTTPAPTTTTPAATTTTPAPTTTTPGATTTTPAPTTTTPGATATANGNCGIIVSADALSARRLATLYQLTGGTTLAQSGCT
jgi:cytoskeletal protein RodZ